MLYFHIYYYQLLVYRSRYLSIPLWTSFYICEGLYIVRFPCIPLFTSCLQLWGTSIFLYEHVRCPCISLWTSCLQMWGTSVFLHKPLDYKCEVFLYSCMNHIYTDVRYLCIVLWNSWLQMWGISIFLYEPLIYICEVPVYSYNTLDNRCEVFLYTCMNLLFTYWYMRSLRF